MSKHGTCLNNTRKLYGETPILKRPQTTQSSTLRNFLKEQTKLEQAEGRKQKLININEVESLKAEKPMKPKVGSF